MSYSQISFLAICLPDPIDCTDIIGYCISLVYADKF